MATISLTRISHDEQHNSELFLWNSLRNGDQGDGLKFGHFSDRSVQVTGTFGAGGLVTIKGTLDGNNWFTLKDTFGNALAITSAGIYQINEIVNKIKPVVAGDGSTNIDVHILSRRMV